MTDRRSFLSRVLGLVPVAALAGQAKSPGIASPWRRYTVKSHGFATVKAFSAPVGLGCMSMAEAREIIAGTPGWSEAEQARWGVGPGRDHVSWNIRSPHADASPPAEVSPPVFDIWSYEA